MFIGHYAAAPVGAATGNIKLWHGFIAVQLVDFIWCAFILLGIEQARIVPGITEANAFDLHFMPYTHSLMFSAFWAVLGAVAFKFLTRADGWTGAAIFAALVMTHWIEDVIVHVPDMTFWPGSEKIGLGLWQNVSVSLPLEIGLMAAGFIYYIYKTRPKGQRATLWAIAFLGGLMALQVFANTSPPPANMQEAAITALISYALLTYLASRFERTRDTVSH